MKNAFWFALIVTAFALATSCDEVEDLLTFSFSDHTAIRVESSSPLALPLEIPTPAVTSNANQEFENNNTHKDLVKDVKLEEVKLTITSPPGKTFNFLETIRIYISASGQDEIELASLDHVPSSVSVIELVPTDRKLDAYVKASTYELRTEITTDETLTQAVEIDVDFQFRVTADAF